MFFTPSYPILSPRDRSELSANNQVHDPGCTYVACLSRWQGGVFLSDTSSPTGPRKALDIYLSRTILVRMEAVSPSPFHGRTGKQEAPPHGFLA